MERIMRDSVNCVIGFREILNDERKGLERQDTMALNESAVKKELCIRKLESLENERAELSVARGYSSGIDDMEPLLAWCDEDSVVKNVWKHFLEVAMTCHELNATNGSIIRLRRSQILSAIEILKGGDFGNETYGRDGNAPAGNTGRSLVQA